MTKEEFKKHANNLYNNTHTKACELKGTYFNPEYTFYYLNLWEQYCKDLRELYSIYEQEKK